MTSLELIASAIGALAVWLTVRQKILGWPLGLVMVLLYSWIFFDAGLYSNMLLQIVFAIMQLYGWWLWRGSQPGTPPVKIRRIAFYKLVLNLLVGCIFSLLIGLGMSSWTDAVAPWQDAALCSFSLIAQFWMAKKYVECWLLWIVLDMLYILLFWNQGLYYTACLYGLFVTLAINGWRVWLRELLLEKV